VSTDGRGWLPRPIAPVILMIVVAVGAGLGIGAAAFGSSSNSTGSGSSGTNAISLPSSLGGFRDIVDVLATKGTHANAAAQRRNQANVAAATVAAYRHAFGGAAAAFRAYADNALGRFPAVIMVRAPSPGLTVGPVVDARFLGLARPEHQVIAVGPVSCQVDWSPPVTAGHSPSPSSEQVVGCQRSGPHLSVFVGGGGFVGPSDLQSMANLVDAAWASVGGG
jgi:hypothetical protein